MIKHSNSKLMAVPILFLILWQTLGWADPLERRRGQFGEDFGYFVYPIAGDIPGLGTAAGFGGTVLNMWDSDMDITGFKIEGDFSASGVALLDVPLLKRQLIFDVGRYDFDVAPLVFKRGMTSSAEDTIQPKVKGDYLLGQVTYSAWQRMLEAYMRYGQGGTRLLEVLDKDGNHFPVIDTARHEVRFHDLGVNFDYTDDRLDPRRGVRLEVARKQFFSEDKLQSRFYVMDYNLSAYLPVRSWDTLAFNVFLSQAHITHQGEIDYATLQAQTGLNCDSQPPGAAQDQCRATENRRINELIAYNRFGIASALGGTQRLRSFAGSRYYAGQSMFYGAEYRWNLTEERVPFNIYMARGIRTNLQLAVFAEQGSVADHFSDLWEHARSSVGLGFRVLLSGIIIRADLAQGAEGKEFVLFITYPWSMFSVDNPG